MCVQFPSTNIQSLTSNFQQWVVSSAHVLLLVLAAVAVVLLLLHEGGQLQPIENVVQVVLSPLSAWPPACLAAWAIFSAQCDEPTA